MGYHKLEAKCGLCLEVDHWMPKEGWIMEGGLKSK